MRGKSNSNPISEPTDPNLSSPFQTVENTLTPDLADLPQLGKLQALMDDPEVTEIMVNDLRNIAIERRGQLVVTPIRYKNLNDLQELVRTLLDGSGKTLTLEHPLIQHSLRDGTRIHIVGPPIVDFGPCVTIRRFPKRYSLEELSKNGLMDQRMAYFLNACVQGHVNLIISGGTGTGKTTLLNALISRIAPHERVITIEDSAEIPSILPNQVRMSTRAKSTDQAGIQASDLIQNSLRMRPDRIIVGEVRGSETIEMVQAMNSGHQGSMTTLHANSCRDALYRIETLMLANGLDVPLIGLRRQIANAIQLVIQIKRFENGQRRIVSIQEITGVEQDMILLQEIFSYQESDQSFRYQVSAKMIETLKNQGLKPVP